MKEKTGSAGRCRKSQDRRDKQPLVKRERVGGEGDKRRTASAAGCRRHLAHADRANARPTAVGVGRRCHCRASTWPPTLVGANVLLGGAAASLPRMASKHVSQ